jgi:hypothetical protein
VEVGARWKRKGKKTGDEGSILLRLLFVRVGLRNEVDMSVLGELEYGV